VTLDDKVNLYIVRGASFFHNISIVKNIHISKANPKVFNNKFEKFREEKHIILARVIIINEKYEQSLKFQSIITTSEKTEY